MKTVYWTRQVKIIPGTDKRIVKRLLKYNGELRGLYLTKKEAEEEGAGWTEDSYEDGTTWTEIAVKVKINIL